VKVLAVTCVKNEGPFLIEWIAYNRVIGVTDFLFYSNDCSDGTDGLLDLLARHGIVRHLPNPATNRRYQVEALKHAYAQKFVRAADWTFVADVDEFLNVHVGDGTIAALIEACGTPKAISVCWQFMANSGIETFEDRPVIRQFLETHSSSLWKLDSAIEVKSLIRKDFPYLWVGAHRPFVKPDLRSDQVGVWTDGSGRGVPDWFKMASDRRPMRALYARGARKHATLNHYALRSMESYLVKHSRGDVNREDRPFDATYWQDRNDPAQRDDSILKYADRVDAEMARLLLLEGVRDAHNAAVAAHRAEIAALRAGDGAALLAELKAAPTLSVAEAALVKRFAALGAL
jgi:Glycosyl transferase family 2